MGKGFIYVLANSSMPGLVKIGKTIKSPSDRALELSKATGVPTPFIVVYEQYFQDCNEAEVFVHTTLKRQGFRGAQSRDFFSAPVTEVINVIFKAPGAISSSQVRHNHADDDEEYDDDGLEFFESGNDSELDNLKLPEPMPWAELWEQAENCYYGLGDHLIDNKEAFKLYKQAAKLGCIMAYRRIGEMYAGGEGVPESDTKALEWYKQGVRHGNYFCYIDMALLFLSADDVENYHKCVRLHFKSRKNQHNPELEEYDDCGSSYFWFLRRIFCSVFECSTPDYLDAMCPSSEAARNLWSEGLFCNC